MPPPTAPDPRATGALAEGDGPRERIEAAAYRIFAERGIRAAGVEDILTSCGAAQAALYAAFGSKDAVAPAYLDRLHPERRAVIGAAVSTRWDPRPWPGSSTSSTQ
ncbi:Putative TetR family transcriptional regulator [Sinomonas atrocyanea]|uniref:Putative TetR family transcriptional regulator n=1 Tax=Sinomonas atrocyanea TaxID=37927 RepID=A0A126ZWK3_9MICC|nr:TetR family transcriptional regulator [Sinomonas atrocyanea]AMM31550.1 Putative TetR family transcriptional regulator [Sinomonas atrocyanea]GEB66019.1 hypothetical protein SAT01_34670 [Sinomonas atrocyanea]GGG70246.1 hypothetical protein GCM10007172_23120 [Sinomonas atrocyanea]